MLLPTRMAVLNHVNKVGKASVNEVMSVLKPFYGKEKQFNEKMYLDHLMALEANGLVSLDKYNLDANNDLVLTYSITEDGRGAVEKYVPKEYQV
ncbi:hypothetical protein [Vagococcus humatus]|uniref:DNA-binding protein n=1 Tax=Vagococcus humatus TaxID=1889241 RepID=A0A3S0A4J7_9ENTE|nr:hypothetical protein [Vagococcus humatus]RST88755.1 hypothetical protein C7P63_09145 [Vagococcus humatus]